VKLSRYFAMQIWSFLRCRSLIMISQREKEKKSGSRIRDCFRQSWQTSPQRQKIIVVFSGRFHFPRHFLILSVNACPPEHSFLAESSSVASSTCHFVTGARAFFRLHSNYSELCAPLPPSAGSNSQQIEQREQIFKPLFCATIKRPFNENHFFQII